MDDDFDDEIGRAPSAVAREVSRLKQAAFRAFEKRGRLPQPLFWSAFGHAINQLRSKKERDRELRDILES